MATPESPDVHLLMCMADVERRNSIRPSRYECLRGDLPQKTGLMLTKYVQRLTLVAGRVGVVP